MTLSLARLGRSDRWLSLAMLAVLHIALLLGLDSFWARSLMLIHLGLFLLWQPLWRGEQRLSWRGGALILGLSAVAILWLNGWLLAFWVTGLFALVGGRVFAFQSRWQRFFYLGMMGYLLAVLLLWVAPQLFNLPLLADTMSGMMSGVLPLLLVVMGLLPGGDDRAEATQAVDFIYSLLLFTLLTLLVLGSLAFMTLARIDYLEALLRMLFILGLMLLLLGWLWNPRLGFAGLQSLFSRYLLNIGTPFESWLGQLAETAQRESDAAVFLQRAAELLMRMPWLSGLAWVSDAGHGELGLSSPYRIEVGEQDLRLTLFCRQAVAPSVLLHIHLLTQLLGHFYQAKRREQELRDMTRLQAIYQTGARLTHDLKNMLQSLLALAAVAQHDGARAQPVLQRQLPVLAQRIETTLAKLKLPQGEAEQALQPLAMWWETLRQRHAHRLIDWHWQGEQGGMVVQGTLLDCVADNLIENACNKRQREPALQVRVALSAQPFSLSVCDSGSAVPEAVARQLLRSVVPSEDGLGIGLYQAARWAEQAGYRLRLRSNEDGKVCFTLQLA